MDEGKEYWSLRLTFLIALIYYLIHIASYNTAHFRIDLEIKVQQLSYRQAVKVIEEVSLFGLILYLGTFYLWTAGIHGYSQPTGRQGKNQWLQRGMDGQCLEYN